MSDDDFSEAEAAPIRRIIHVDMDAFYASVEQRDDPALRGKPVAVGGGSMRGVVAAASYEARVFGVRSAMASVTARRRCPELLFVKPRFEVYKAVSNADPRDLRRIYRPDRAAVARRGLSRRDRHGRAATDRRRRSRRRSAREIRERTGLTASAGVSYNKFIAKIASDQNKPDGLCVITPKRGPDFVAALPVKRFHGIGPVTAAKMARLGIETGADLRARPLAWLQAEFGKAADYYYRAARGHDDRPVRPNRAHKSVGAERTFDTDLIALPDLLAKLDIAVRGGVGAGRARRAARPHGDAEGEVRRLPPDHASPQLLRCRSPRARPLPRPARRCSRR